MRRVLYVAAFFLMSGLALSAQQPTGVDANDLLAWDYDDATFAAYSVTHFERQTDGGAWTQAVIAEQSTTNGLTTYATLVGQLTNGTHTVSIRACNAVGCSVGLPFVFDFGTVLTAPPAAINPRIFRR